MEYIYAAVLLHKAGKKVDENGVKAVLTAAGVKADESRNSDGFHNPDMAKQSLLKSAQEAFHGIKIIDDAMAARTTALK